MESLPLNEPSPPAVDTSMATHDQLDAPQLEQHNTATDGAKDQLNEGQTSLQPQKSSMNDDEPFEVTELLDAQQAVQAEVQASETSTSALASSENKASTTTNAMAGPSIQAEPSRLFSLPAELKERILDLTGYTNAQLRSYVQPVSREMAALTRPRILRRINLGACSDDQLRLFVADFIPRHGRLVKELKLQSGEEAENGMPGRAGVTEEQAKLKYGFGVPKAEEEGDGAERAHNTRRKKKPIGELLEPRLKLVVDLIRSLPHLEHLELTVWPFPLKDETTNRSVAVLAEAIKGSRLCALTLNNVEPDSAKSRALASLLKAAAGLVELNLVNTRSLGKHKAVTDAFEALDQVRSLSLIDADPVNDTWAMLEFKSPLNALTFKDCRYLTLPALYNITECTALSLKSLTVDNCTRLDADLAADADFEALPPLSRLVDAKVSSFSASILRLFDACDALESLELSAPKKKKVSGAVTADSLAAFIKGHSKLKRLTIGQGFYHLVTSAAFTSTLKSCATEHGVTLVDAVPRPQPRITSYSTGRRRRGRWYDSDDYDSDDGYGYGYEYDRYGGGGFRGCCWRCGGYGHRKFECYY